MTAKGPVIILVVDGGRSRDKRSGGGRGVKAISDWQERKLTNIYKEVESGISKLRYSFRVVHRPRWVKQLNSRL